MEVGSNLNYVSVFEWEACWRHCLRKKTRRATETLRLLFSKSKALAKALRRTYSHAPNNRRSDGLFPVGYVCVVIYALRLLTSTRLWMRTRVAASFTRGIKLDCALGGVFGSVPRMGTGVVGWIVSCCRRMWNTACDMRNHTISRDTLKSMARI